MGITNFATISLSLITLFYHRQNALIKKYLQSNYCPVGINTVKQNIEYS